MTDGTAGAGGKDGVFRFKRFSVRNERSAMKVGTDGVLLGAAVGLLPSDRMVLDAGTGTGVVALILAQRLSSFGKDFSIKGIDIDPAAVEEAAGNFASSPWSDNLQASATGLSSCTGEYDLIVSNPPYYDSSLTNPDGRRTLARHISDTSDELSYRTLAAFASARLRPDGRLAMILPADCERDMVRYCHGHGIICSRMLRIKTVERKSPSRIIAEFRRGPAPAAPVIEELTISDASGYTEAYSAIVGDFYLWG